MRSTLRWILILIGLLILVGAATVILPALLDGIGGGESDPLLETSNEPATVSLNGYLLGEELAKIEPLKDAVDGRQVDPLLMAGVMAGMIVVAMFAVAVVLAVVMRVADKATTGTRNNESYQESVSTLDQREQAENKELKNSRPPDPIPTHERPRWNAVSTALVILMFVAVAATLVLQTLRPAAQVELFGTLMPAAVPALLLILLVTAVILFFTLKPKRLAAVDDTDYEPVSWSAIWVLLTGFIFIGIGTGIMIAVRTVGG